ncbi:TonB-dependent receptor plug domain-containing protein [Lysobacter cavernae]|uniref:TonB-dependent receptor plug domain-containing protein n=1 Tax=Lysobacter cavernae TaxID=1685901 RepID=A0ABV7RS53_9GAMM
MRVGMLPAGIAIALAPAFASAQEGGDQAATTLDRIEVTGSRIRQVDVETAAPVLLISRQDIENQGFNSVADILQNITAAGSPAISRTSPLSSGEEVGGQYIDLRNLGANRTLILVNGKRLGITNGGMQDVASIPAAMVERIEVLKDGASTTYGSDAIAGVVNIITRKNFEGAEASAYIGQYDQGDGTRQVYDFLLGFSGDRGSLTAGVEYTKEDPVWARDRWFAIDRYPTGEKTPARPGGLSGTTQYGRFSYDTGNVNADGDPIFANRTLNRAVAGLDPRDFANYRNSAGDTSNPAEQSTVYTGIERKSVFLNGHFDITDSVGFDTDVLYTDRESFAQNAGYPYQSARFGTPMSADSYFNPVGNQAVANGTMPAGVAPQDIDFVRRGWEVPRQVQNNLTTFRFTGAFSGAFEIGEKFWDWDAGYLYNQNKGVQISTGNLNTQAVGLAVGPSFLNADGVVQCGTAANPIQLGVGGGQCTPWNPLVPAGYGGQNTASDPNVAGFLYLPGQALSETETTNYFANLSGTIATLPAGDLGVAVGVEHRKESGSFSPDGLAQTGISTDLAGGPTAGGYSLDEVYAEFLVPILADVAFAKELSVSLASRYSDYDTFGDTTNSKFGFKWKPFEQLLVRGTWAEGFRAPTVSDLYGGLSQTFDEYTDPCDTSFGNAAGTPRCLQDVPVDFRQPNASGTEPAPGPNEATSIAFMSGSNPELTPETSTSKTLGFVWSPSFAEGLNLSLDWYNIKIENTIINDTVGTALADCYVRGIESRCNATVGTRFTRDPVTGVVTAATRTGVNAGYQEVEGYDFDVSYSLDTAYGKFGAAWQNSYVTKNELKTDNLAENPPSQQNGFGGYFRLRSNLNLSWEKGDFGASWGMRYYSGVKENCSFTATAANIAADRVRCTLPNYSAPDTGGNITPMNEIGANTFHDLQVRWNAPWNATVSVGANNVFDHQAAPEYDQPNSGYSYYGGYDIGRFVYMKYQQRF